MKIAEIRAEIRKLNWIRHDLSGFTRDEFRKADIPLMFESRIKSVESLEIKPRFADDIHDRDHAVKCAKKVIDRWHDVRAIYKQLEESKKENKVQAEPKNNIYRIH